MTLFDPRPPLAARMRPKTLDDLVGQEQVTGEGTALRALLERDELRSVILWGPPGTGKTTIAHIIADRTSAPVAKLSAISAGVADVRKVIAEAQKAGRIVLFLDEIHRFNRAQQDALLGAVEDGSLVLVGATTENPYFEVNSPLISRSLLFRLEPLTEEQVIEILRRALERDLAREATGEALQWIADRAGGDARSALNALEAASELALARGSETIELPDAQRALEQRVVRYDKKQDRHYDVISAFIKSMRGSDADAALFWLAEMLEGGEDPRFICRRMIIFASEDVGMADSQSLVVAVAAAHALEHVGLPEASLNMAHAAVHLARAPKSRRVTEALVAAQNDARARHHEVPDHIRGTRLGRFDSPRYVNPRNAKGPDEQSYRPPELEGKRYYEPEPD